MKSREIFIIFLILFTFSPLTGQDIPEGKYIHVISSAISLLIVKNSANSSKLLQKNQQTFFLRIRENISGKPEYVNSGLFSDVSPQVQEYIPPDRSSKNEDSWIARDKAKHFLAAMFIQMNTQLWFRESLDKNENTSRNTAIGITISLSLGKEILDQRQQGNHFCWKDLTMDVAGMIAGIIWVKNL